MVNEIFGRLPIYDGRSLGQWVTGKISSNFVNAVGKLQNVSEQKTMLVEDFRPIFSGNFLSLLFAQVCVEMIPTLLWRSAIEA